MLPPSPCSLLLAPCVGPAMQHLQLHTFPSTLHILRIPSPLLPAMRGLPPCSARPAPQSVGHTCYTHQICKLAEI